MKRDNFLYSWRLLYIDNKGEDICEQNSLVGLCYIQEWWLHWTQLGFWGNAQIKWKHHRQEWNVVLKHCMLPRSLLSGLNSKNNNKNHSRCRENKRVVIAGKGWSAFMSCMDMLLHTSARDPSARYPPSVTDIAWKTATGQRFPLLGKRRSSNYIQSYILEEKAIQPKGQLALDMARSAFSKRAWAKGV